MVKGFVSELSEVLRDPFLSLLTLYLVLLLLDTFWDGKVNSALNLNYLLVFVIATGILSMLKRKDIKEPVKSEPVTKSDYIFIAAMSILGAFLVWYKIQNLGTIAYVVSFLAGLLIFLLSVVILEEDEDGSD